MKKLILLSWLIILASGALFAQDTLIYRDGRVVLTEVQWMNNEYVFHRPASKRHKVSLYEVEVRLAQPYQLKRPLSFGIGAGWTVMGTGAAWKDVLQRNGLSGGYTSWYSGKYVSFPRVKTNMDFELNFDYRYSLYRGWGAKAQWFNQGTATGYSSSDGIRPGELDVNYGQFAFALYHRWFLTPNGSTNLYVGPMISGFTYDYEHAVSGGRSYQESLFGGVLGLQFPIAERDKSFVRLSLDYNYVPPVQTSAFTTTRTYYEPEGPIRESVVAVRGDEVRLSSFALRLQFGLKAGTGR